MSLARALIAESRGELMKIVRVPVFMVPTLLFPAMFYLIFGITMNKGTMPHMHVTVAQYMIGTYGTFGVIAAGLFGLGIGVAVERAQGWLTLKRASPMPPAAYFGGKVVLAMTIGLFITLLLGILGVLFGGVQFSALQWFELAGTLVLGVIPFCIIGCAIAYMVGPNSAPAVINLIYLPMSFASGLWIPIEMMPKAVQAIAPSLPPYHLSRIALHVIGADPKPVWGHIISLAIYAAIFMAIAIRFYRNDDGRTFG